MGTCHSRDDTCILEVSMPPSNERGGQCPDQIASTTSSEDVSSSSSSGATSEEDLLLANSIGTHHYEFAHVALRKVCFGDPDWFFRDVVAQNHRTQFLDELWRCVRHKCDETGEPGFDVHEVDFEMKYHSSTGCPMLLISMPLPDSAPRAYFVVIAFRRIRAPPPTVPRSPLSSATSQEDSEVVQARYFTLEKGCCYNLDKGGRTDAAYFCEWADDGTHINMGEAPFPVDARSFVKAVEQLLIQEEFTNFDLRSTKGRKVQMKNIPQGKRGHAGPRPLVDLCALSPDDRKWFSQSC